METTLLKCQCVCFLIGKKLNLSFADIRRMAEDLNNLRGAEWQDIVDTLNDQSISAKWREWCENGGPTEVIPV